MRIIYIRQQDYWVFPISVIAAVLLVVFLYAGVWYIRVLSALGGFGITFFIYYIIKKNYTIGKARHYVFMVLLSSILTAWGVYALTN